MLTPDATIYYKDHGIDYDDLGFYTVQFDEYAGDELSFMTVEEAKEAIDEATEGSTL